MAPGGERTIPPHAPLAAVTEEGPRSGAGVGLLTAALLSFVGALTLANAPYLFFGYGLSAFAVFAIALACRPGSRIGFVVGLVVGVAVYLTAQSVSLFVGAGAAVANAATTIAAIRRAFLRTSLVVRAGRPGGRPPRRGGVGRAGGALGALLRPGGAGLVKASRSAGGMWMPSWSPPPRPSC